MVSGLESSDFTSLDAYIRAQLDRVAERYAARSDIDSRLTAILEAGQRKGCDQSDGRSAGEA